MATVSVLQHVHCENLGSIADALNAGGIQAQYVRVDQGQGVPRDMQAVQGLIIMGGPMGVYEVDRYPFLAEEMRLIEHAVSAGKPVLGICLGSQLLAAALGSEVKKGRSKEIGWHEVTLNEAAAADGLWSGAPSKFTAFHWHGDVFDLPPGAVALASSAMTPLQAFRFGSSAYGLLFHMEVTVEIIGAMIASFDDEVRAAGLDGAAIGAESPCHLPALERIGAAFFGGWAKLIDSSR
jgi:GMP synthase (glutamine-hydrolysing)